MAGTRGGKTHGKAWGINRRQLSTCRPSQWPALSDACQSVENGQRVELEGGRALESWRWSSAKLCVKCAAHIKMSRYAAKCAVAQRCSAVLSGASGYAEYNASS
ncbi:hypothetical protein AWZ03_014718 [Drosophila navojoa]|uniref:Uncharacterized protein n=1 Tax=Drosophila navojoa TaxID=7232 RepID=A0A484ASL3_DRONA|nr:hypothetical protein AWZ03_014718 [Drosophila navojoa]